jgi:DNA-directed RNA polymerase subunit RPC12/RpoP
MVYKLYGNLFGYKERKGWVMNEFKAYYTETNICLECGRPAGELEVSKKAKCPNCGSSEYTKAVRRK